MMRRKMVGAAVTLVCASSANLSAQRGAWPIECAAVAASLDLERATIAELRQRLAKGELTAEALACTYVRRILLVNVAGPSLHAVQSLSPDWREQARQSDLRHRAGRSRGPLDGIPVLLKDNIDARGSVTSAGSIALRDNVASGDAAITVRLRRAGAIILGKTTMSEFAYWEGGWGYSSLGGQPLNPYDGTLTTSGSSAGSAIATATGLATIAIGTDTGGSVVTPAHKAGVFGLRPSTGLVSRVGIVPITKFADTPGVMGRTVADVAAGLTVIVGVDPDDSQTSTSRPHQGVNYLRALVPGALRGKRVGIDSSDRLTAEQVDLWQKFVADLERLGAIPVSVNIPLGGFPFKATDYEFRLGLDDYLAKQTPKNFPIKSVISLAAFYRENGHDTLKYGGKSLFAAEAVDRNRDRQVHDEDLSAATLQAGTLVRAFATYRLDMIAFPETELVNYSAAVAGLPELAVPIGLLTSSRSPFGSTFVAARWNDAKLLGFAFDYEHAIGARPTPSQVNPAQWRCVDVSADVARSSLCLPGTITPDS